MEPRLIYESNKTYFQKAKWLRNENTESEWHFIGIENNVGEKEINKILVENFDDENLYFVMSRNESSEMNKTELTKKISEVFRNFDFTVWDKKFRKVIEFNKIGIYRIGINASC